MEGLKYIIIACLMMIPVITHSADFEYPNSGICGLESVQCEGELSMRDYVLNEFKEAGLDERLADKIIKCESNWNRFAQGKNSNGSVDSGLFQINSIHKFSGAYNYKEATKWAINKVKRDGGWSAWSCLKKVL